MLTQKDLLFMNHLRKCSRRNLTAIAKETNIPVSTLFDKLKKLEGSVITRHTSLLNFNRLGFSTRAKILLKVNKKDRDALANYLKVHGNINSVFKITNGYDFMVESIFMTIRDMEMFMEDLGERFSISKKEVYYIIEEIKREDFMTNVDIAQFIEDNNHSGLITP